MKSLHDMRMPGESKRYRQARERLLGAEIALRRQIEAVAQMRRKLPDGGLLAQDYEFDEMKAGRKRSSKIRLSALFGAHDSLVVYSFMYGPNSKTPCPMCASMLDSLDGSAEHIGRRASLVVVAKSPIERVLALAKNRGWSRLRLLSSFDNSYNRDYFGETAEGNQMPAVNVFRKKNGAIRHFYHSELLYVPGDGNQHPRHVDMIWPLWNVLDLTPEGRGADWLPRLSY
jgi:predicted dithiol-disulfide oxidoreductase (DUF899 family)